MLKEVIVHPGAVVILPFLDADHVLLIRNRRYAVGQTLLELPAGTLEKGEDPLNAAGRVDHFTMVAVSPLADFSFDYQDLFFIPQTAGPTRKK